MCVLLQDVHSLHFLFLKKACAFVFWILSVLWSHLTWLVDRRLYAGSSNNSHFGSSRSSRTFTIASRNWHWSIWLACVSKSKMKVWATLQTAKFSDTEITDLAASKALGEELCLRAMERTQWDSLVVIAKKGWDNSLEIKNNQIRILNNAKLLFLSQKIAYWRNIRNLLKEF